MGNTFDLSDFCGCDSPCESCCGDCCPGLNSGTTLVATFSGFDSSISGSVNLTWDAANSWWGKGSISMGACGTLTIWVECPSGGSSCSDLRLRYSLLKSDSTTCDYTGDPPGYDPWTPDSCSCSPLNLSFALHSFQVCLADQCGKGTITITT